MGKKRERDLEAQLVALRATVRRTETEARENAEARLRAAAREMSEGAFLIVTKTGHVVQGRALDVQVNQPTVTAGFGDTWMSTVPVGPREYSAHITIEPIK